jgi:hypothetical protein
MAGPQDQLVTFIHLQRLSVNRRVRVFDADPDSLWLFCRISLSARIGDTLHAGARDVAAWSLIGEARTPPVTCTIGTPRDVVIMGHELTPPRKNCATWLKR